MSWSATFFCSSVEDRIERCERGFHLLQSFKHGGHRSFHAVKPIGRAHRSVALIHHPALHHGFMHPAHTASVCPERLCEGVPLRHLRIGYFQLPPEKCDPSLGVIGHPHHHPHGTTATHHRHLAA